MVEIKTRFPIQDGDLTNLSAAPALSRARSMPNGDREVNFHRRTSPPTDQNAPEDSDFNGFDADVPSSNEVLRLNASYWKARALRVQSDSDQNTVEIRRIRQWMEEMHGEVEILRREQRRAEEQIYENLIARSAAAGAGAGSGTTCSPTPLAAPGRSDAQFEEEKSLAVAAALESQASHYESQVLNLTSEVQALRSQVHTLEEELNAVAIERDQERERIGVLDTELSAFRLADEARTNSGKKLDSVLTSQEKHVELLETKLAAVDAKLLLLQDALRGSAPKPEPKAETKPNVWHRLRTVWARRAEA